MSESALAMDQALSSVEDKLETLKIDTASEQYVRVAESGEVVVPVPESTVVKVTGMINEIKTILNSPTKIPSLTKTQLTVDPLAPPPAPVEGTSPSCRLKRKSMSPTRKDQLSERLYAKAMELKHKRDLMYTQPLEECTFKPNILKTPVKSESGPPSVTSSNGPPSQDKDRFAILHEQAKELAKRKEEKKLSAEAQYSFKPEISKKSRRISSKLRMKKSAPNDKTSEESPPTTTGDVPTETKNTCRFDELYAQHIELAARRKEKQLEMERKTAEECTFQPKIKKLKGKSPPSSRPLYDAERERQKRLEKEAKKTALEMAECTFRPAIARPKTASDAKEEKSFFDRMQESERKKEDRLEQLRKEQEERKLKEATFIPKIKEIKSSKANDEKKPFHERLFDKEYLLQQQAERERKKQELEQFPFKPTIDTSNVNIPERHGSIFERLHDEGMKKQEILNIAEQERIKREMEECTFRPQVSVEMKEPPTEPVWERLSNDKKHILEERQRLKEELESKECTFKPDLGGSRTPPSRRNTHVMTPGSPTSSSGSSIPKYRRQSSPTIDNMPQERLDPATTLWKPEDIIEETPSIVPPFPASTEDEVTARSRNILDNYDLWAASLEEKMRELK